MDHLASPLAIDSADILSALEGPVRAAMLYGSYARGDANASSDIDVLHLIDRAPGRYSAGKLEVSRYTPQQLGEMAEAGSLFVLHLREEGVILVDDGTLSRALGLFRFPDDNYEGLLDHVRLAGSATDIDHDTFSRVSYSVTRAALYLLRTVAYVHSVRRGVYTFSMDSVADVLGDSELTEIFTSQRVRPDNSYSFQYLRMVRTALQRHLGITLQNPYGTLEALAVSALDESPSVSDLVLRIMANEEPFDYANLPMLAGPTGYR